MKFTSCSDLEVDAGCHISQFRTIVTYTLFHSRGKLDVNSLPSANSSYSGSRVEPKKRLNQQH
jgi:hypothetical protein